MLRSAEPIALPFIGNTATTKYEAGITLTSLPGNPVAAPLTSTDIGWFDIPFKCKVYEAGILITTGLQGTNPGPIDFRFDVQLTAGSATGRTDGTAGIVYLYETGASAAGDVCYDLAGQTPYDGTDDTGCSLLEPGMRVVFQTGSTQLYGAGLAGVIVPYLLVEYLPEVRGNLSNMQQTT